MTEQYLCAVIIVTKREAARSSVSERLNRNGVSCVNDLRQTAVDTISLSTVRFQMMKAALRI